jgi:hypothetical protein
MKKISLILLVLFTSLSAKAGCDFSGIAFKTIQQQGNNFYFQTNMHMDSCWYYTFTAYSFTNKEEYKLDDMGGWTGVTFNQKGKYEVRLNVFNECEKCDTVFTIDVDITIFGKLGYSYNIGAKNCKYYQFELEDRKDRCTEYYYQIWKADAYINGLSEKEWKEVSDSALYFGYSFDEDLLAYYSKSSERTLTHEFEDSGRYIMLPQLYNNCTQIDTWAFKKLNVCVGQRTTSIKKITREDLKNVTVVGYYDMLGRRVDALEPNKIYIIFYSNGRRQKVMRTN